jgi:diguanylate cyclase (GGDEF)-like protein
MVQPHPPEGEACALLVVDLDNFKPINDVYGHRLGDEVLKVVAKRLTRIVQGGSVARLGGDEFGIILRYRLGSDAPERLAKQVVEEISKPVQLAALALQVGVSVGVSAGVPDMAKRDGTPVETALRQADMAMYWAKSEGRSRYRLFDRSMDEKLQLRVELGRDRRRHRLRSDRSLLSADRRSPHIRHGRLRSAGPMGASDPRPDLAQGVRPDRRGHGSDRQDDRQPARAGGAGRQELAR